MRRALLAAVTLGAIFLAAQAWAADDKLTVEELIAKHLDSIGTAEARAAAHTCGVDASARYVVILGGAGQVQGTLKLGSDGHKQRMVMRFQSPIYVGEDFVSDGEKVSVAPTVSNKKTILAPFFMRRQELIQEGLFGGTLTSAWPLLDLSGRKPTLRYNGLKKVDGRELHELSYEPRRSAGDLKIRIYFEPGTFRHVMTVYDGRALSSKQQTVSTSARSSGGIVTDEVRETLTERFSDFRSADGIVLPSVWTVTLANNSDNASEMRWEIVVHGVVHTGIDPNIFKVR